MKNGRGKQRGVIDVEGWSDREQKKHSSQGDPEKTPGSITREQERSRTFRKRFGPLLAISVALLAIWWIVSQFRYEIIPVGIPQRGEFQYIVRDRWTDEIEVVWQRADGKLFRSSRRPFESAASQ